MMFFRFIYIVLIIAVLTMLTQIGGLVYIISFLPHKFLQRKFGNRVVRNSLKFALFILLYSITTFVIVPILAKPFGRVQLPLTNTGNLKPLNFLTCFLNRNYVQPGLRTAALDVASQMNNKFPGSIINYLDAGFPFIDGFPLFPHLSHNDGKKLDISFCYVDNKTGTVTNLAPSFTGYGICEEAKEGEINTSDICKHAGSWQYSFLKNITPQANKQNFTFDVNRTKELVNLFVAQPSIEKIFIEPHLKARLKLTSSKVRFQGCAAVRHDDHIHVQIK